MSIGIFQLILIFLIVLLVFGAGKLPKIARDMGNSLRHFRKGVSEDVVDVDPKDEQGRDQNA